MSKFDVSIIIPCYNSEKYIEKAINSILEQTQTERKIQIILVNDGSTDSTYNILKKIKLENKTENIIIINQKNKGVSVARNIGIKYSEGEYIMFIDSDDWIDKECIKRMYNVATQYNSDIVKTSYYEIDSSKQKIPKEIFESKIYEKDNIKDIYIMFMNSYKLNTIWGMLIKRHLVKNVKFEKNMVMGEDLKFNLEIFSKAKKITTLNEKLYYYYRGNEISVTRTLNIKKIYNELVDTTNVYYSLMEYNKRWNLNYPIKLLMKRINKEILKIIKKLYIFPVKRDIRLKILNDYANYINDNDIRLLANSEIKKILKHRLKLLDLKYLFKYKIVKKLYAREGKKDDKYKKRAKTIHKYRKKYIF